MNHNLSILYLILLVWVITLCTIFSIYNHKQKEHQIKLQAEITRRKQVELKEQAKKETEEAQHKIDEKMQDLVKWVGIAEPTNNSKIIDLVLNNQLKAAVKIIAKQLNLGDLDITVVKKDIEKRGKEDNKLILAEVNVTNVGNFGTSAFRNRPYTVIVYRGHDRSLDTFISVIAHELCHIVLHSLRPPCKEQRDEEQMTDLAVIFSGFRNSYKLGRLDVDGNRIGYLDDTETEYALNKYDKMLAAAKEKHKTICSQFNAILDKHKDIIEFIKIVSKFQDNKVVNSISEDDMYSINLCFNAVSPKKAAEITKMINQIGSRLHLTRYSLDGILSSDLKKLEEELRNILLPDTEDIQILYRC